MGACSSKPKTTEFEGSTEPAKETEVVAADRGLRPVDAAQISQLNEPSKQEIGAADVKTEALQQTSQPIASKHEEPLVKGLTSTEEGVSHSVRTETEAIDGDVPNNTVASGEVDTGRDVQKVDESAAPADIKEVSDIVNTGDGRVRDNQDKNCEVKAVVLDEVGADTGGACLEKGVAADDEKGQDGGTTITQDEQSKELQNVSDSPRAESPIIGVVQPADPVHVDDVSESVGLATLEIPAPVDSSLSKPPVEIERDVSSSTNTGKDDIALTEAANVSSDLPQETSEENKEALHDDLKGSPSLASASDDAAGKESGPDDIRGTEELRAFADVQDVKDATKPEKVEDPQNDIDERTTEPPEKNALEESAKELYAEVPENGRNAEVVDGPKLQALRVAETSTDSKTGTTVEEAFTKQAEVVEEPDVNNTRPQTLAVEELTEDGKPEAPEAVAKSSADKSSAETKCKEVEKPHINEATVNKEKVETVDTGKRELPVVQEKNGTADGDLAYEDASDVPLKVESRTTELGDTHSS